MDGYAKIVMSLDTEEDVLKVTDSALLFEDDIWDWQFRVKQFLKSKQETPASQFHHASSDCRATTPRIHINLHRINIKSCEGDPSELLTFWESFSSAVDKNLDLSDVERVNYLNGMLKEEAARAISGLPLTEENDRKASEILKERFGKT